MTARAGSPASEATSANRALIVIGCAGRRRWRQLTPLVPRTLRPAPKHFLFDRLHSRAITTADATVLRPRRAERFYGWRVVQAAFVLGMFGWGLGFFGPPVFLSVLRESRGWPLVLISAAASLHFLV